MMILLSSNMFYSLFGKDRSARTSFCHAMGSLIVDSACLSDIRWRTAAIRFPWSAFKVDFAWDENPDSCARRVNKNWIS